MTKHLPKPDHELLPAPKRPWGTGSIEVRAHGYLARWRNEHGKQQSQLFPTAGEAADYLNEVYPKGSRLLRRSDVVDLIEHWRTLAVIASPPASAVADESEAGRASALIRSTTAQAFTTCASDLARLLGYG